jgi:hypothetical protein
VKEGAKGYSLKNPSHKVFDIFKEEKEIRSKAGSSLALDSPQRLMLGSVELIESIANSS